MTNDNPRRTRLFKAGVTVVLLGLPVAAIASPVTVPNAFSTGEVISSSQMNANFTAVQTAVDDNDARVTALEAAPTRADCAWEYASDTSGSASSLSVTCPTDTYPITGGCTRSTAGMNLIASRPEGLTQAGGFESKTGWLCSYSMNGNIATYALCCPP